MRFLRYLPEIISNLLGAFAWRHIIHSVFPLGFGMDLWFWIMVMAMGAALIATPLYYIMRKPGMRRHFAFYMLPLLVLAPGLVLGMLMYNFTNLLLVIFFAALPVFPFCAIYERLFSYQFTKEAERAREREQNEQA